MLNCTNAVTAVETVRLAVINRCVIFRANIDVIR